MPAKRRESRSKKRAVKKSKRSKAVISVSTRGTPQWKGWVEDHNEFDGFGHSAIRPPVRMSAKVLEALVADAVTGLMGDLIAIVSAYSIYAYPKPYPTFPFAVHRQPCSSRYMVLSGQTWRYRVDVDEALGRAVITDAHSGSPMDRPVVRCFEFHRLWTNRDMYEMCHNYGSHGSNSCRHKEEGLTLLFELPDRSVIEVGDNGVCTMDLVDGDSVVQYFSLRGGSDSTRSWVEGVHNTYYGSAYLPNECMKALYSCKTEAITAIPKGMLWHRDSPWQQIHTAIASVNPTADTPSLRFLANTCLHSNGEW